MVVAAHMAAAAPTHADEDITVPADMADAGIDPLHAVTTMAEGICKVLDA